MKHFFEDYGNKLRQCRLRMHMTQQELADRMNQIAAEDGCDEPRVIPAQISKWEHGAVALNIYQEDLLIRALLTNVADLHQVQGTTDLDRRVVDAFLLLPFRSKQIIYYLLSQWNGNPKARLEADLLYSCLPREDRADVVDYMLNTYRKDRKNGTLLQCPIQVDSLFVTREQEKL